MSRVLVVAAHPDDAELGAGATLAKHAAAGDQCFILVLSQGITSRYEPTERFYRPPQPRIPEQIATLKAQAEKAAGILGAELHALDYPDQGLDGVPLLTLTRAIEAHVKLVRPDVVYTHSNHDVNGDHSRVAQCVAVATRPLPHSTVKRVLAFEIPGSTGWQFEGAFLPRVFVDVSGSAMQKKCEALACYVNEMREAPHPRSMEGVLALAAWRGATVGVQEAESFELVRSIE